MELSHEEEGDGQPLLLLHGLTATRRYVLQGSRLLARERLPRNRLRRARPRRLSPAPEPSAYEYRDLVADLREFLDEMNLDRPVADRQLHGRRHRARARARGARSGCRLWCRSRLPTTARPRTDPSDLEEWEALARTMDDADLDALRGALGRQPAAREVPRRGPPRGPPAPGAPRAPAGRGRRPARGARLGGIRRPRRPGRASTFPSCWWAAATPPTRAIRCAWRRSTRGGCRGRGWWWRTRASRRWHGGARSCRARSPAFLASVLLVERGADAARSSPPPGPPPRSPGWCPSTAVTARARRPARPGVRSAGGCPPARSLKGGIVIRPPTGTGQRSMYSASSAGRHPALALLARHVHLHEHLLRGALLQPLAAPTPMRSSGSGAPWARCP